MRAIIVISASLAFACASSRERAWKEQRFPPFTPQLGACFEYESPHCPADMTLTVVLTVDRSRADANLLRQTGAYFVQPVTVLERRPYGVMPNFDVAELSQTDTWYVGTTGGLLPWL